MDIADVFPEDPLEPTLKYIGNYQAPFTVPWAKGRIQLCSGFDSQRSQNKDALFKPTAFQDPSKTLLWYRESQTTRMLDDSSSDMANSSENRNFSISASIGGDFLGASGRGNYEKRVRNDNNKSNISVRADHVSGQINVVRVPPLAKDATQILNTSDDPVNDFRQKFGDFYLAGCKVGAVCNTTISGELACKTFFEATRLEYTVKVLFVKKGRQIDKKSESKSNEGVLRLAAFDTVDGFTSNMEAFTQEDSILLGNIASANKQRAMNIGTRASAMLLKEFSLGDEGGLYQDVVDRLCDKGLVTELLLAPFAGLREYQSILARRTRRQ